MPKKDLTEIIVVMDKSGSMDSIRNDAMGAFNTFLDEQKKVPGSAVFTLTLFDTTYTMVHKRKAIKEVPQLTYDTYVPGGMTALLDAVGRTIDEVGKRLADTADDERPERVVMAIITDGQENSSREYKRQQIMERIQHQTDTYKWVFVFLAAGKEAFAEAQSIGIQLQNIANYAADSGDAYKGAVRCFSSNVSAYRGGASGQSIDWSATGDTDEKEKH